MQGEKLTPPRALIQGWVCMRRMCAAGRGGGGTLEFAPFHKEGLVPWLHFAVCRRPAAHGAASVRALILHLAGKGEPDSVR